MDRCDVLIVGGGPAGSTCARQLTRSGLDVVIIDKASFPRDKVCAGWVTPAVLQTLDFNVTDYRQVHVLQDIIGFRTGTIGGASLATRYDDSVSFGIRRCEFDHYLLMHSGARMRLGEAVDSIERTAEGWVINGTLAAPMLVGAGGHFCPVARHLGSRLGRGESAVTAQEIEFNLAGRGACSVEPGLPEVYFCRDLSGYGWCFRKGDYLNVGLGREGGHRLAESVRDFWRWLERTGKVPEGMTPKLKGHAYVLYGHSARTRTADGVVTVGDAAGLAYAESGEGIRTAVESGVLAAEAIVAANGDYSRSRLDSYEAALAGRFGRGEGAAPSVPAAAEGPRARAGRWLLSQSWFVRHIVINRWFLHAHVPALRPVAAAPSRGA